MTTKPFLARYGYFAHDEEADKQLYDPERMLLTTNGRPVASDPTKDDRGRTLITRVKRETTDDK